MLNRLSYQVLGVLGLGAVVMLAAAITFLAISNVAAYIAFVSEQVTHGHIMVVDGWAGASNAHPHPTTPYT